MQTKQKPQTTHTWTHRLTETHKDTNRDTYKHRNIKICKHIKRKTISV